MKSSNTQENDGCYSDAVFEELAFERLDPGLVSRLLTHVQGCSKCQNRMTSILQETRQNQEALAALKSESENGCISTEGLAQYIDNSLSVNERNSIETHLSSCGRCQASLVSIYRHTGEALGQAGSGGGELDAVPDSHVEGPIPWSAESSTEAAAARSSVGTLSALSLRTYVAICGVIGGVIIGLFVPTVVLPAVALAFACTSFAHTQFQRSERGRFRGRGRFRLILGLAAWVASVLVPVAAPLLLVIAYAAILPWISSGLSLVDSSNSGEKETSARGDNDEKAGESVQKDHVG